MRKRPFTRTPRPTETGPPAVSFPGLNGLRFFAAMAVAVSHVELIKQYNGYSNAYDKPAVYELGRLSVTLFFVLSGFLITYLLLVEQTVARRISVKNFYVRRILRIWPLYYLVVLLSFFVLPHIALFNLVPHTGEVLAHPERTLPLFLVFLPQLALALSPPVPFAEPTWSIGVEEQFYLFWPLLMRRFTNTLKLTLVVVVVVVGARYGALAIAKAFRADPTRLHFWNQVINYLYFTRLECMAIGGLAAALAFGQRGVILRILFSRPVEISTYVALAWLLLTDAFKPVFSYVPHAFLFAILILNVAANPRILLKLSWKPLVFLGNISFSIYMFHEMAIQLTLRVLSPMAGFDPAGPAGLAAWLANAALYGLSLSLTIAISTLSYLYLERPFLRLKSRFSSVTSGGGAA